MLSLLFIMLENLINLSLDELIMLFKAIESIFDSFTFFVLSFVIWRGIRK
ncbi:hypothetical protein HMPREF0027_0587 [Actinobacillus ureae ATCC 25976]|uniref:Uncharacterized protein n=1 Tax=Actinobacillus ureae ATCC 25976 TaxID=887324 RepID=E8KFH0_9PAST|nr:hypothetical protein HMPREF0027_0587 [Actinobacillus ureae ATCC 25976]